MNLKKDALLNTIGNFSYLGVLWLMSVLVVRLGDFEKAGYFSLALTTANIYIAFASYTVRLYYAADLSEKYTDAQYFLMRIITTFLSVVLCLGGSIIVGYTKYQIAVILLFYVYKVMEMLSDILFGALQRHQKLYLSGYSLLIKSCFSLLGFAMALYVTSNLLIALIVIDIIAILVFFFIDIPMCHKAKIKILVREQKEFFKSISIIKICFPLFIVGLCYNIIPSIPRLAFERMYSAEQYGIYSSISTLTVLISTAANCIAVPFVPKFAEYYVNHKKNELKKITLISVLSVSSMGVGAWLAARICGEWVLILLFGTQMKGYGSVFSTIIIATIFTSIIIFLNDFFVAVEKQRYLLYGCITGAVLCVILAIPLCRCFYMNGVAYNLIISQGIEMCILFLGIKNVLSKM